MQEAAEAQVQRLIEAYSPVRIEGRQRRGSMFKPIDENDLIKDIDKNTLMHALDQRNTLHTTSSKFFIDDYYSSQSSHAKKAVNKDGCVGKDAATE